MEPGETLAPSVLFNAWYKDKAIQVAVANPADSGQSLKVAIGTEEIQPQLFASQSLPVPPHTIKLLYFPVLRQKTSRGNLRNSDYFFIFKSGPEGSGLIGSQPVQNLYPSPGDPTLDSFIATPGDEVRFSYELKPEDTLRLILAPKSVRVQENLLMAGRPQEWLLKALTREELDELKLPDDYRKQVREKLAENYAFAVKQGKGAGISILYTIPEVKDCVVTEIPDYRYFFTPSGGVLQGGGRGATLLIYNPRTVIMKPLLDLKPEGEEGTSRVSPSKQQ